jgi:cytochrome c-type biogenesis protein CcmH/NrfG
VRTRHAPARAWYNLGIAYQRLYRYVDALAAYEHAAQMPDATPDMPETARTMKAYVTRMKL